MTIPAGKLFDDNTQHQMTTTVIISNAQNVGRDEMTTLNDNAKYENTR
jgi:hypothetical protein